jgi:Ca2+/Na+ antiporter
MGYLTIYTRSNRVVIISSVITRIFFNSVQCLDGHLSTYSINTLVIYLCCALYSCASYTVHYYIIVALCYYFC